MNNSSIVYVTIKDDKKKSKSIQSHINRLYVDYIATREGTDLAGNDM